MEGDFRNLTAKVWANLDNPVKRYDFSKVSLILCMSPSQMALFQYLWCHNSTTVYWNCTQNFTKFHFSWKCIFPLLLYYTSFIYIWGWDECACIYEWTGSKGLLISKKIWKCWKSMYKVNGELSSCDITCSGRVPSREGDIHYCVCKYVQSNDQWNCSILLPISISPFPWLPHSTLTFIQALIPGQPFPRSTNIPFSGPTIPPYGHLISCHPFPLTKCWVW